jgi:hypothetical protein
VPDNATNDRFAQSQHFNKKVQSGSMSVEFDGFYGRVYMQNRRTVDLTVEYTTLPRLQYCLLDW